MSRLPNSKLARKTVQGIARTSVPIVTTHHGAFDATDAPGGGAWFSMTLPVDLPMTQPAAGTEALA